MEGTLSSSNDHLKRKYLDQTVEPLLAHSKLSRPQGNPVIRLSQLSTVFCPLLCHLRDYLKRKWLGRPGLEPGAHGLKIRCSTN